MAQTNIEYAPFDDVMDAGARLGRDRRERLAWAVQFAQEELNALPRGRLADLRMELTGLLGYGHGLSGRPDIELFSEEEMHETQNEFADIIARLLQNRYVEIGTYTTKVSVMVDERGPHLLTNMETMDMPRRAQAVFVLGLWLGDHADLVKTCPAPKPRRAPEEACGTWFVGRPNQVYCSPLCQNRATTRAVRKKRRPAARRRPRSQ
jgi:hypothetical protein